MISRLVANNELPVEDVWNFWIELINDLQSSLFDPLEKIIRAIYYIYLESFLNSLEQLCFYLK